MEILAIEHERSQRNKTPFSLLMIDLDHFKDVNDTYGHQDGDVVLQSLAELLRSHLRQYDTAARFGGEEFSLVLPETAPVEAAGVAERIRTAIGKMKFAGNIEKLQITASIGVATTPNRKIETVDDLLRAADGALYDAKSNGRNRVEVAD